MPIYDDGWCPNCQIYVEPRWVDCSYGTCEFWGTRIKHEARAAVCPYCDTELEEEPPLPYDNDEDE